MTDARETLSRMLASNRGRITEEWIAYIKKHPIYATVPAEEIEDMVSRAFDGYRAHVCDADPEPLDEFVAGVAAKRVDLDFPLSAMLSAFDGFRVVVTPMLFDEARRPGLMDVIEPVFDAVNHAKTHFAEHYQELAAAKLRTQMRELETALQQLKTEKERAEQAVSIKDRFLSNISHELRTPLTVIMGFSRLLASAAAPAEKTVEISELIHKSGEALLKIVEDVILMSKLEGGHEKLYTHFVYVTDLIRNSAVKADREFPDRKNTWEFNLPGPEIFIIGDHQKLESLFLHLFSNAIKFSPAGSKISASSVIDHEKSLLVTQIKDEGLGIPVNIREAIFDKFSGKDPQASPKYQGLGRGLALARMIANVHGGDVILKATEEGKGSVFTVTLSLNSGFPQDHGSAEQA